MPVKRPFIISNFQRDSVLVLDKQRSFVFQSSFFVEGKAGMLTNMPMLRDFKKTEEEMKNYAKANENMKIRLRNWWEG